MFDMLVKAPLLQAGFPTPVTRFLVNIVGKI